MKEGCAVGIFYGPVGTLFKMELSKLNFNDIQGEKMRQTELLWLTLSLTLCSPSVNPGNGQFPYPRLGPQGSLWQQCENGRRVKLKSGENRTGLGAVEE